MTFAYRIGPLVLQPSPGGELAVLPLQGREPRQGGKGSAAVTESPLVMTNIAMVF